MHSLNSSLLWKNGLWGETGESEVLIMRTHSTHNTPTSSTTTTVSFSASHQAWTNTHTQTVWAYLNKMPRKLGNSEISSGNPGLIKMDVFFFPPWLLWCHARPRSSAIEGGAAMWGCAWFLKWAGRWTGGGEHCKRFCYWGKLHHHDLNCESSSIAHNELLFWAGDGSLQLHACWICGLN